MNIYNVIWGGEGAKKLQFLRYIICGWPLSSRFDYCNCLLYGVSDGLLKKLQAVQHSATRVVTNTRKFDHNTPALRDLHWLPIRQRILFKLAIIVFKCLHGLAPSYLADDCVLASAAAGRHLRSADTMKLLVRRSRTVICGRDFAVSAAAIWNSQPAAALRLSSCSVQSFARKLKNFYASATMYSASEDHLFCALQMHSLLSHRSRQRERLNATGVSICSSVCLSVYRQITKTRISQKLRYV